MSPGLRQLRHVPQLPAPRRGVPRRGAGAGRQAGVAHWSGRREHRMARSPSWLRALRAARRRSRRPCAACAERSQRATGQRRRGQPARLLGFDQALVWVVVALLALGLVMVYSASVAMPDNPKFARYAPTYFLTRHIVLRWRSPSSPRCWRSRCRSRPGRSSRPGCSSSRWCCWSSVLIPCIGKGVNGARRWIPLGFISFQPSRAGQAGDRVYAADYMVRKMDVKENFFRAVLPMASRWLSSACCCWPSPTWAPSW